MASLQCGRLLVALAVALPSSACTPNPDVIASRDTKPFYFDAATTEQCSAGNYAGTFETFSDGGSPFDLRGTITFALVRSLNGEFLELRNDATLYGESPVLGGSTLTATLRGTASCQSPPVVITTVFQQGEFKYPAGQVQFTGQSSGLYDPAAKAFAGFWESTLIGPQGAPSSVHFNGSWYARRVSSADGG